MARTPFTSDTEKSIATRFGVWLFIAACASLFLASIVGYIVIRLRTVHWPTNLPPLPRLLWISTAVLLLSSFTIQVADNARRRGGKTAALQGGLLSTFVLGCIFLAMQTIAWIDWLDVVRGRWEHSESFRLALSGFYVFTSIHAVHLIGGLIPLAVILMLSFKRTMQTPGVHGVTLYWHFLDVVWILLFVTLLIAM